VRTDYPINEALQIEEVSITQAVNILGEYYGKCLHCGRHKGSYSWVAEELVNIVWQGKGATGNALYDGKELWVWCGYLSKKFLPIRRLKITDVPLRPECSNCHIGMTLKRKGDIQFIECFKCGHRELLKEEK